MAWSEREFVTRRRGARGQATAASCSARCCPTCCRPWRRSPCWASAWPSWPRAAWRSSASASVRGAVVGEHHRRRPVRPGPGAPHRRHPVDRHLPHDPVAQRARRRGPGPLRRPGVACCERERTTRRQAGPRRPRRPVAAAARGHRRPHGVPHAARRGPGRRRRARSPSTGAGRSASSASRARARRCSAGRSWACCPSATSSAAARVVYEGRELIGLPDRRAARAVGHRDGHGLPGPDDLAQPGAAGRPPDHRGARGPPRPRPQGRPTPPRSQLLRSVGIPEPERRLQRVPAPAVGRHAPAGDDRHRPGLRAQAALRRRADHRPRRDRPGPDPRPAGPPAARARHGDDPRHPRPRRGGRPGRRDRGDVRRPDRREGARPPSCSRTCACPTPRRCCARSPGSSGPATPAAGHPRAPARPRQPADGLPVRAPLPVRPGPVPCRGRRRSSTAGHGHLYRCWFPVGTTASPRPRTPTSRRGAGRGRRRRRSVVDLGRPSRQPASRWEPDGRHRHRPPAPRRRGAPAGRGPRRRVPRRARGTRSTPCRASARHPARARRSAWSASRAAASRPPARRSCSCPGPRRAGPLRRPATSPACRATSCAGSAPSCR